MSDQGNVICNISVSMDCMLYCACSNTEVYCILRCVIIHQRVDDSAYKCISASDPVEDMKGQTSAFINLSIFPQICQKAVFAAAVCKTDMSGNTFQIRILFDKCAKYLFLLVTIRLKRNIILYIACGMILILFPDMVRLDAKEDIHIQNR